jgi:cytochrome c556
MKQQLKQSLLLVGLLAVGSFTALAQAKPSLPNDETFKVLTTKPPVAKVVKGAPYSATATTETVQTLNDGNQIIRRNETKLYRDSQGRTRSEQSLGTIGKWTAAGEPAQLIHINDPVSGFYYDLDPRSRTAVKGGGRLEQLALMKERMAQLQKYADWQKEKSPFAMTVKVIELAEQMEKRKQDKLAAQQKTLERGAWPMEEGRVNDERKKLESLGKQIIEGVEAIGNRSTFTIPAGEIGNTRPIEIVNEEWYSPELDLMVLTKRSDPRTGETTYRLTNLTRNEPDRALFEVPADYTLTSRVKIKPVKDEE